MNITYTDPRVGRFTWTLNGSASQAYGTLPPDRQEQIRQLLKDMVIAQLATLLAALCVQPPLLAEEALDLVRARNESTMEEITRMLRRH